MNIAFSLNRRDRERVAVDVFIACRVPAVPIRARLCDISRSGCRIRFADRAPECGSSVSVDLGAGSPVFGEIVWQTGYEAGVRFRGGLSSAQAVHLGLESPPPVEERIAAAPVAPSHGLLSHWMRRISSRFAGRGDG